MNKKPLLAFALLVLPSCHKREPGPAGAHENSKLIQVTRWTDTTELFLEYPPLVKGQTSRFAIHLTNLHNFRPIGAGRLEVEFGHDGRRVAAFGTDAASRPGIFGVDVRIDEAGAYDLVVRLQSAEASDTHEIGPVQVHPSQGEAAAAILGNLVEETNTFLKEQQWALDFRTEAVGERIHRASLRVPAEIEPRTGGVGEVTVPFAARLVWLGQPPALGTTVAKGHVLGGLVPPTSSPADLPAIELQRAEAEASLELARKERARIERLLEAGAVPVRRQEEARAVEATAAARLKAAQARIAHYEATRAAEVESSPEARVFLLRAPISGQIAETHATGGANVEVGENLFKIIDVDRVYVVGKLPEAEASRIRRFQGAELEIPGILEPLTAGRLVSIGRLVDPRSRTIQVIYEVQNRNRVLAVGQVVSLRLFTSESRRAPAVPETAIVDDAGRPIVFVQVAGESFARRSVKLGDREGGYVHVLEGVRPGERVVSRGAYLLRLSAMSGQLPAHGHVH